MTASFPVRLGVVFGGIQLVAGGAAAAADTPAAALAALASGLVAAVAAAVALGGRVSGLARDVCAFSERVAAGELDARVDAGGRGELAAVAASVNAMAARLARESHARVHFISRVSHELRTPLTVIKGNAFTLTRREDDPARLARLDVINGECEHLAYLVEDLLELSRAQAGQLRISTETFPLRDCVEDVARGLQPVAEGRGVGIELDWSGNGALVMGDENRVRQIFANLIWNGIKYAPPGTAVRVRGDTAGDALAVTVEDAGRGIAETDLPHIWSPFYQSPDRSEPGAGLGLAIVRELVLAHGGEVAVETAVGQGTRFRVTLPAWEEVACGP